MAYYLNYGTRVAIAPGLPTSMSGEELGAPAITVLDADGDEVPFVVCYSENALHSLALDYKGNPVVVNSSFIAVPLAGDFSIVPK